MIKQNMKTLFSVFFKKIFSRKRILFFVFFLLILPLFSFADTYVSKELSPIDKFVDGLENYVGLFALGVVKIFSEIFWIAAVIFDNLLAIGLSTGFFKSPFISEAWESIRDIANAVFILGFLYVAFQVMLGMNSQWQKTFVKIIVVALVMNFSLFLSKGIIDAGNITARLFYNSIGSPQIEDGSGNSTVGENHFIIAKAFYQSTANGTNTNNTQFRSIAGYFQSFAKPENLFGVDTFKAWKATKGGNANIWTFVFMCVLVSFYLLMMAKTLFKGGFFFLTRVVWLVYYIIISPFALISMFIPKMESFWKEWLGDITDRSFCIAVYLFLIWLSSLILGSGVANINPTTKDDFWIIMSTFVLLSFIIIAPAL